LYCLLVNPIYAGAYVYGVSGGADPILDGVVRMDRGFLWIGLRVMTAQSLASGGHCGRMEV
jgi:hypothetical protein